MGHHLNPQISQYTLHNSFKTYNFKPNKQYHPITYKITHQIIIIILANINLLVFFPRVFFNSLYYLQIIKLYNILINQFTCIMIFLKAIQDHEIQESKNLVLSFTLHSRINFSIINYY